MSQYINGQWRDGNGEGFISEDPLCTEIIWKGKAASKAQLEEALQTARKNFGVWSKTGFEQRCKLIENYSKILEKNKDELAMLISREMGKPLWESKNEVQAMIGKADLSIKAHLERCAEKEQIIGDARSVTRFHPIGVCLVLGPFNLPAHLPNGHIIPALLAGNTVIFKPSEKTPAVGETMIKYLAEAGFPKGVIQMVQGGADIARHAIAAKDTDIIAFTGSYRVGAEIHKSCAGHPEKMLALEMGGNNPLVVWEPEDISMAAYTTLLSTYLTSGQRCVCARRLILPEGKTGDEILHKLVEMIKGVQIRAWDESPQGFMGPVIDDAAGRSVLQAQAKSLDAGAIAHYPSKTIKGSSALISPGLLEWDDAQHFKDIMGDHEVFGPLLNCFRADSFTHAIELANDTQYGLAAGLVSKSRHLWDQFRSEIRAGITNWNRQITGAFSSAPFGGIGHSGNFRPSAYFAADYCSYPSASIEVEKNSPPDNLMTGLEFKL